MIIHGQTDNAGPTQEVGTRLCQYFKFLGVKIFVVINR